MSNADARNQLNLVRRNEHHSARGGAFGTASIAAALVLATGVVIDLDMLWLLGLVVLGFVGLSVARPLRLRLDWSDRVGMSLLVVGGVSLCSSSRVLGHFLKKVIGLFLGIDYRLAMRARQSVVLGG